MNKKIFVLLLAAIFLIASVGFISAEESYDDNDDSYDDVVASSDNMKDINVQKVWNDNGFENKRPSSVQVELYADGKLVDRLTLSDSNGWKATFKNVDVSSNIKVVEVGSSSDYDVSYSGNAENGFVITSKIIKTGSDDVLGTSNVSDKLQDVNTGLENLKGNETGNNNDTNGTDDPKEVVDNNTNTNTTDNTEVPDNDKTADKTVNKNEKTVYKNEKTVNKTVIKAKEKISPKKPPAKPSNPIHLRNTGLPIVVLALVAGIAIFIPLNRKK